MKEEILREYTKKIERSNKVCGTFISILMIATIAIFIGLYLWAFAEPKPKTSTISSIPFSRGTGCDYSKFKTPEEQTLVEKGSVKFENNDYAIYEYEGKTYTIEK